MKKKILPLMLALTVFMTNTTVMGKAASTGKPMTLKINQTQKIVIDISKGEKLKTTYRSTNPGIASVSKRGIVRGISGGKCTIKTKIKYRLNGKIRNAKLNTPVTVKGKKNPNVQNDTENNTSKKNPSETEVYNKLMKQKSKYPQDMKWTTKNKFTWKVLRKTKKINGVKYKIKIHLQCRACMAFAARMSNAAFGTKRTGKKVKNPKLSQIKTGDILVISSHNEAKPKQKHAVVVLSQDNYNYTVVEGNLKKQITDANGNTTLTNGIINWGRKIPKTERVYWMYTRYK